MIISYLDKNRDRKLFLSDILMEKMIQLGESSFPNEYGGILVGIKEDKLWYITDIEVPKKFENSRTKFIRYADYLNDYLQKIFDQSNGRLEYLGEWHTHPNGTTNYSMQDLISMQEIADNPSIKNKNPFLIILSIGNKIDFQCYNLTANNLVKFNPIKNE